MLELRPGCECCDKDLPPDAADAMICTFECTFCRDCVETRLARALPELRRQFRPAPDPAGVEAGEISALDPARVQARGLRTGGRRGGRAAVPPGLGRRESCYIYCFEPAGS